MDAKRNWHIVLTKPQAEKKVCESLQRKNIEYFLPVNKIVRTSNNSSRIISKPLFERYVFVNIATSQLETIRQVDGIQQLIYWLGTPVVIGENDIKLMREFTREYMNVKVEKIAVNATAGAVKLYQQHKFDVADELTSTKKICKTLLPALGYALVADTMPAKVEVLKVLRSERYALANFFSGSLR